MARTAREGSRKRQHDQLAQERADTGDDYATLSARPFHILIFLLPLLAAYEIGSGMFLRVNETTVRLISAQAALVRFFELFGLGGVGALYLPGVVLIVVLLIWHVMLRDSWRIHWRVPPLMLLESVGWTVPLLVLGQIVYRIAEGAPPFADAQIQGLSLPGRAAISGGAGLYEELVFRLLAIAAIHFITADVLGMKELRARIAAVAGSALLFALYHDIMTDAGGIDVGTASVLFMAGLYFGGLYVMRGFGIVVATHALYDLTVLVLLPQGT